MNEVGAYISSVDGNTPTLEFEVGEFYWQNYNGSLKASLLEEPDTRAGVDETYQLEITVYSDQDQTQFTFGGANAEEAYQAYCNNRNGS